MGEALGTLAKQIHQIVAGVQLPANVESMQGTVQSMNASFRSFAVGLVSRFALPPPISWRADCACYDGNDAECYVANGRADAGGDRDVKQHSDCGVCSLLARVDVRVCAPFSASLATIIGLLPMAMKLGEGSESMLR